MECAGSGVGEQLLDPGLSELYHPGDCLMGLQNYAGKRKQYGKLFLPGFPGHMSCGSGSGLGSTRYTRHQHHAEPSFALLWCFVDYFFIPGGAMGVAL